MVKEVLIETLIKIDELIKSGNIGQAQRMLSLLYEKREYELYKEKDRVFFCSLLRRCGRSLLAIRILQPFIYPKVKSVYQASSQEKLEYASALVRLGILTEADKVFATIEVDELPIVLVRRAFLFISQWDFKKSNELLISYIQHPKAEAYDIAVAEVNYLQGLTYLGKIPEAMKLFESLQGKLEGRKLLLAAIYEFASESQRLLKNYSLSLDLITKAQSYLDNQDSIDAFLIEKQLIITKGYHRPNKASIHALMALKKEAMRRQHYESIRDIDLHLGILLRSPRILNKVYWGTRSSFYKERLLSLAKEHKIVLNLEEFKFKKNKGTSLNSQNGLLKNALGPSLLKSNQALHRLLKSLLSDFYKPQTLFGLFNDVYQNEIFFPKHSPDKMHQLIKRFRSFLLKSHIPLELIYHQKKYTFKITNDFTLSATADYSFTWQKQLENHLKKRQFRVEEAQTLWNCSYRTATRRLATLKKMKVLSSKGQTKNQKFYFN